MDTLEALERELKAIEGAPWTSVSTELHRDFREMEVFVTIPDDDPFEPSRLNAIFDAIEKVIVSHIPRDIGIRDDTSTWSVMISTDGDNAPIDTIYGGQAIPSRTMRGSDKVGPPNRG
jgi:hypothetical protein